MDSAFVQPGDTYTVENTFLANPETYCKIRVLMYCTKSSNPENKTLLLEPGDTNVWTNPET